MTAPVYLILGKGGQGRDVLDALLAAGRNVAGVFDDGEPPLPAQVPLLGKLDDWRTKLAPGVEFIAGMGDSTQRAEFAAAVVAAGGKLAAAVHPAAIISPRATVGAGTFVAAGCVIAPEAVIHDLAFVNANCSIDHDCQVGVAAQISPGVTLPGGVVIGDSTFIGAGAVILPGKRIGVGAVVGAGSVVTRDVAEGVTVSGNPAKPHGTPGTDNRPRLLRT